MDESVDPAGLAEYRPKNGGDRNAARARIWRENLLQKVRAGQRLTDVLAELGINRHTYEKARYEHKDWGAQVTAARAAAKTVKAPESKQAAQRLDDAEWSKTFLGMTAWPHQLQISQAINETLPGEITLILSWTGCGKSTSTLNWATRAICENPNIRIALVSEGQDLTKKFVGRLERRLGEEGQAKFPLLHAQYGPFHEDGQERQNRPWAAEYFRVAKATSDEADHTVAAAAWRSRAYGSRFDRLIVDDIQSVVSLNQTEAMLDSLRQTYFTRDMSDAEMPIVIVGSRVGPGDIYERLMDEGIIDRTIIIPAANYEGDPTCPEAWPHKTRTPREVMERRRKRVGDKAWYAAFQQRPAVAELSTFAAYIDDALDHDRPVGTADTPDHRYAA